jgi:hypothetical protein
MISALRGGTQEMTVPDSSTLVSLVKDMGLLNLPWAWIGIRREDDGLVVEQLDQLTGEKQRVPFPGSRIWLRARCDFLTEKARFGYSTDGETFTPLGAEFVMIFQLKTFQGVRYSLFHYNDRGAPGGWADFDDFTVAEPNPRGQMQPIPIGRTVSLQAFESGPMLAIGGETRFSVVDRGKGRVALRAGAGFVSVSTSAAAALRPGEPGDGETFQWTENVYGDVMRCRSTHRYLGSSPEARSVCNHPGEAGPEGACAVRTRG